MKTILRKIVYNLDEYFCVVDHNLEEFHVNVLSAWELSKGNDSALETYKGDPIEVPKYVSTINVDTTELLETNYTLSDSNNLFARFDKALKKVNILNLLKQYPDGELLFNREKFAMKTPTTEYLILEPMKYWVGDGVSYKRVYYKPTEALNTDLSLEVYKQLLTTVPADTDCLFGINPNEYSYHVFKNAWYDVILYLEYIIMNLMFLNQIAETTAKWEGTSVPVDIVPSFIKRSSKDISIEILIGRVNREVSRAKNLPDLYRIINTFTNQSLSTYYRKVVKSLDFISETQIDWGSFTKVYIDYLDNYITAVMQYLRWQFLIDFNTLPEEYYEPLEISTPIGKLIMIGGVPTWKE